MPEYSADALSRLFSPRGAGREKPRAVPLAAGRSRVVFEYAPGSLRAGVWLSLGSAVLLGILYRVRRPSQAAESD